MKGRLSADLEALYDEAHPGTATAAPPPDDTAAAPPEQRQAEQTPRSVTPPSGAKKASARVSALWGKRGKAKRSPRRRNPARVPTAAVIERLWSQAAWAARSVPPMQRLLAAQAGTAGIVLQDAIIGTPFDRPVQAIARAEDKFEAANAMIGPPLWVVMIMKFGRVQTLPAGEGEDRPRVLLHEDGSPVWEQSTAPLIAGLRFSLMSWLEVSQRNAEEIKERGEELTRYGQDADDLIRWIFSPPRPGQTASDIADEATARTAAFVGGEHGDEDQADEAGPETPGGNGYVSTAFMPVRAEGQPDA